MKKIILLQIIIYCSLITVYAQDTSAVKKNIHRNNQADSLIMPSNSKKINFLNSIDGKSIELLPWIDLEKLPLLNSNAVYYNSTFEGQGLPYSDNCFIDGMRTNDFTFFPVLAIDHYDNFPYISPIEYGNSGAGFMQIKSKVPADKASFSLQVQQSLTGAKTIESNQSNIIFCYSSPFLFLKSKYKNPHLLPSILFAGTVNFTKDPDPSYIGSTQIDNATYAQLEADPFYFSNTPIPINYSNSEFVTGSSFHKSALKENTQQHNFNPYIKLVFPVTENAKIVLGSFINIYEGKYNVYENTLFNSNLNPEYSSRVFNNYLRFEGDHKLTEELKINYHVQINYTLDYYTLQSSSHKDNFFDYGYVGKFTTHKAPYYEYGTDLTTGLTGWLLKNHYDAGIDFESSNVNPELSVYTQQYYSLLPYLYYHLNISNIQLNGGLINGQSLYPVYGLWNKIGTQYDLYAKNSTNKINPTAIINFDYRKNHHFSVGFEYDKSSNSSYALSPVGLWTLARQLTNEHIAHLDFSNPHPVYNMGVFQDTINYDVLYDNVSQTFFDKNLRQKLGLPVDGTDWIDIDSYSPETFDLKMFSPDELLNDGNSYVDYMGYDCHGNKQKSANSLDFFSALNSDGYYTRNIAAFKPVYENAFMQYTFTAKHFNLQLGMRVDRYDANQPVLKDPFLLYEAKTVAEVHDLDGIPVTHPSNMGSDYVVYVNDKNNPTQIVGYRNGFDWYNSQGNKIYDPTIIETSGGIMPYLKYPQQDRIGASVFSDYKPVLNYLPEVKVDWEIIRNIQLFGNLQTYTQNPVNNYFQPERYFFIENSANNIINNPDLKPMKITDGQLGFRSVIARSILCEISYLNKQVKGVPIPCYLYCAYPADYITSINDTDKIKSGAIDVTINYVKPGKNEFDIGVNYERLLTRNQKLDNYRLSNNIANNFLIYKYNKQFLINNQIAYKPSITASLVNHVRTGTYFFEKTFNKVKLPDFYTFDIKIEKIFYLWKNKSIETSIFMAVQNIFNKKNLFYIYYATGKPDDDGFLSDPAYQNMIHWTTNEQSFRDQYACAENNPYYYDAPRMIIFGFKIGW